MYVKSAKISFGKHVNREFSFDPGVNLIRGANEAGKSTLINAIAYCLFGSKVLEHEIAAYKPDNAPLKTEVEFGDYTCVRGASGAELRRGSEVICTNHGPVTTKVEEILSIPNGNAQNTVLAPQGKIKGVMSLGPTAISQFIEAAAGFDQLDEFVQSLFDRIKTGSTAEAEAKIEQKLGEVTALVEEVAERQRQDQSFKEAAQTDQQRLEELRGVLKDTQGQLAADEKFNTELQYKRADLERQIREAEVLKKRYALLDRQVNEGKEAERRLQTALEAENAYQQWLNYQEFLHLPKANDYWEGDEDSLSREIEEAQSRLLKIDSEAQQLGFRAREWEAKRLNNTVCPITKRVCAELSDPALVEKTNKEVDDAVAQLRAEMAALQEQRAGLSDDLTAMRALTKTQATVKIWCDAHGDVSVDRSFVPWRVLMETVVQVDKPEWDAGALRETIERGREAQVRLLERHDINVDQAKQALVRLGEDKDLTSLRQQAVDCSSQVEKLQVQVGSTEQRMTENSVRLEVAKSAAIRLELEVEGLKNDISELRENNDLVKAVKAGRAVVNETLWNKVLIAISSYFSAMRGEHSIVERTQKGFAVAGMKALSGSTEDILAMAMRVTIAKLFTQCPFIIVDEGSAACDETRSAAMVSTLAGAGFNQALVVSHRAIDESAGVNLIEIT